MPDHISNISQADSEYIGNFIRGLPILKPFKIHYHDPRKQKEDDNFKVGVFMILPQENIDDAREILDLTITIETSRMSHGNELEDANIKSKYQQDLVEVKIEPTSDQENDDTDTAVNHNGTYSAKGEKLKIAAKSGNKMSKSTNSEASTSFELKVEIENVESGVNFNPLNENKRFKKVSNDDIDNFREINVPVNQNTKRKTEGDLKLFNSYLENVGEERTIESIPPEELNDHICGFLLSVTKKDGEEYEPTTIRSFVSSIDRHLRTKNYKFSVINSVEFKKSRQVLKNKQKQVISLGKGNKSKATDPLDDAMIETFHECGALGDSSPVSLIHSLWLICTVRFGMKSGQEIYSMKWGDIQLKEDAIGEYLQYDTERQTKTRTGVKPRDTRLAKPRAYATSDPQRDPVHLYTAYKNKRPADALDPDSPFFLSVANKEPTRLQQWYKPQPMGINKIYGILNEMKHAANITTDKKVTPYSARKHFSQKLNDNGVPAHQVVPISCHKNVNSIDNCRKFNPGQCKSILDTLPNVSECKGIIAFDSDQEQSNKNLLLPGPSASCSNPFGSDELGAEYRPLHHIRVRSDNTFTGPVNFHFAESSSIVHTAVSQTQYNPEPLSPPSKRWKKMRRMSSSSESE